RAPREKAELPRRRAGPELHLQDHRPGAERVVAEPAGDGLGVRDDGAANAAVVARVGVEGPLLAVAARVAVGLDEPRILAAREAREVLGRAADGRTERRRRRAPDVTDGVEARRRERG